MIVHFDKSPAKMKHMVPYATLGGKKVVIDLQTGTLGHTGRGAYKVEKELTLDEAAMMYYREFGDYYLQKKDYSNAIKSYEKALSIYGNDSYVYYNLAVCYQQTINMDKANAYMKKAAELDPKRPVQKARMSYNAELAAAGKAFDNGDYEACVAHYKNALDSGETMSAEDRAAINENKDLCQGQIPK
jgi:tetratricopeptide (TPR) repeat protein